MAEHAIAAIPLISEGHVIGDAPCLNCGYNLRTLAVDALCPECAHPVYASIRGDQLRYSSPVWVRRLARGFLLMLIAVFAAVAFAFAAWIAMMMMVFSSLSSGGGLPAASIMIVVAAYAGMLAIGVVWVVGAVFATSPDPATVAAPEGVTARRVVRFSLCMLGVTVASGLLGMASRWVGLGILGAVLAAVYVIASIGGTIVLPLAGLRHAMSLMSRIPRPGLVKFAKFQFWAYLILMLLTLAGYAVVFLSLRPLLRGRMAAMTATASAPAIGGTFTAWPYTGQANVSTTTVSPTGVQTTTTMPAGTPIPFPMGGTPPLLFPLLSLVWAVVGCGSLGLTVAGVVMLVLMQRALSGAAVEAEQNALVTSSAASM